MKKGITLITILLIFLFTYLCAYKLITNSSKFQIDYSKLQIIYDYKSREDSIPQYISELMILNREGDFNGLPFNLSGEYHREQSAISSTYIENEIYPIETNFAWKRYNSDGENDITIYFTEQKSGIITFAEENRSSLYRVIYDNGKMIFRDDSFVSGIYTCDFKYPVNEETDLTLQDIKNFF